jgi:hypothetical protein
MWIASKNGFFSIVQHRDDAKCLIVRSRAYADLADVFDESRIRFTPEADYHYRVYAHREELVSLMTQWMRGVDYPNFKSAISKIPHQMDKLESYHKVWSVMHTYQAKNQHNDD